MTAPSDKRRVALLSAYLAGACPPTAAMIIALDGPWPVSLFLALACFALLARADRMLRRL